jgi:UTP--glucose-1-phosphate uridylyltransferase
MGSGTPVLNAAHLIGDEPFLVLFGDDFFASPKPRAVQLVEAYEELGQSVISLTPFDKKDSSKYGVVEIKNKIHDDLFELSRLVEKPEPADAPSDYASVGGFVLTPDILTILQEQQAQEDREFYLADAIDTLAQTGQVFGKVIEGKFHDTGNKESYLRAIVDVALDHPELGESFRAYLKERISE